MTSILFATTNQDKIKEARSILDQQIISTGLEIPEIQSLDPDLVASQKARDYFAKIQQPLFIEDVSLTFNYLSTLPGPYISDFLKAIGNQGLTNLIPKDQDRTATATTTLAYIDSHHLELFKGSITGTISTTPLGDQGFGWDPIFIPSGQTKTYAQMTDIEKSHYSMRRLALEKLRHFLLKTAPSAHPQP